MARATLAEDLNQATVSWGDEDWLHDEGACFVTLHRGQELRGCIGTMLAFRPLLDDLRANARSAAFRDPRFPPLQAEELADQLRPGIDGLLLECGPCRATFLPAVWSALPEPAAFLGKLKVKAGLPADFWTPEIEVKRYTTESWSEDDLSE